MAKDFFQDILPKDEPRPPRREPPQESARDHEESGDPAVETERVPERSIRNINVSRPRPTPPPASAPERREMSPLSTGLAPARRAGGSLWLWVTAAILLLVMIAIGALMVFRMTTVTITPRSHAIVFDASKLFTAYPEGSAPQGALSYAVQTFDLDETETVTAKGSSHAERKATGSVTVVNESSAQPLRFVKTTRFETPDGLIFRAPTDITVPGAKNGTPGSVTITLVADQAGDKYNIGPTQRFTLPGLKGGSTYDTVYAKSSANFSGGFAGEEPSVAPEAKNAAEAEMQGRLKSKIASQIGSMAPANTTIMPSLLTITFEELAPTTASDGQVQLHERAHVSVPAFPTSALNTTIASSVIADSENASIVLTPKEGFAAALASSTANRLGSAPIDFALTGSAQITWNVDTGAIAQALAGKDQAAFQTVVNGFPGVQEARARIEPFWLHSFPSDPSKIKIVVTEPKEAANP